MKLERGQGLDHPRFPKVRSFIFTSGATEEQAKCFEQCVSVCVYKHVSLIRFPLSKGHRMEERSANLFCKGLDSIYFRLHSQEAKLRL